MDPASAPTPCLRSPGDLPGGAPRPDDAFEVTVFDEIEAAEACWRAFEADAHATLFQTYDWLAAWQQSVGTAAGVQPCIAFVRDEAGEGLMLLPLGIEKKRGCRVLVWLGAPISDYRGPLIRKDEGALLERFAEEIWPAIQAKLPDVDYLHLTGQPSRIDGLANPFAALGCRELPYAAHATRLEGDWPSYQQAKRSAKSRSTERRKEKKLRALGELTFTIATSPEAARPMLDALIEQKTARLAEKGAFDLFAMPGMRDFIEGLTAKELDAGELNDDERADGEPTDRPTIQLSALTLDGRVLAVHWGAIYRGRFHFLVPALQTGEHAQLSPGGTLINHLLAWAFEQNLEAFDFTVGDEPYKAHWCELTETMFETLLPVTARGWAAVLLLGSADRLYREIRARPKLHAAAKLCTFQKSA